MGDLISRVVLFGASGTMGYEVFKELWNRRETIDIVLLLLPGRREKKLFAVYEKQVGIKSLPERGVVEGNGLKIVWGDATHYPDVAEAIRGADWVLNAMAFISPAADYYPEMARAVNTTAIQNIVDAIQAEPDGAARIRLVHTSTVAATGDRPPPIHWGRVGDPLKPSIFDFYAVTKIAGERIVLESQIKHWAVLRMTFIMPTHFTALMRLRDPIMFHMPIHACMENITSADAGYGMANVLDIPDNSDFWRRVYNMGGGPGMRISAADYQNLAVQLLGLSGIQAVSERRWFALRNFHMQYYFDSWEANQYLHYWRTDMESYKRKLLASMPAALKLVRFVSHHIDSFRRLIEKKVYTILKGLAAEHRNGPLHWYLGHNDARITAFYKDYAEFEAIPDWGVDMPDTDLHQPALILDHGYDEEKALLELADLQQAAKFRGGECLTASWDGSLYTSLAWRCARGHSFSAMPYTILKAGHWCPDCMPPAWNYDEEARLNPFFAQVWYPNHGALEDNMYPAECVLDIAGADKD
ncbi:MAG: NAD-dependent epimerase/dehydratase family protein [Bellilinea sp.]